MQDNAPVHKAKCVLKCFKDRKIDVLEWPPNSPDLNPIENLWSIWKQKLKSKINIFSTAEEIAEIGRREWRAIPTTTIQNIISSMPKRLKECSSNMYGSIKY